jgi:hypothetical protein
MSEPGIPQRPFGSDSHEVDMPTPQPSTPSPRPTAVEPERRCCRARPHEPFDYQPVAVEPDEVAVARTEGHREGYMSRVQDEQVRVQPSTPSPEGAEPPNYDDPALYDPEGMKRQCFYVVHWHQCRLDAEHSGKHSPGREAALPEPPSRDTIERLLSEANAEGWTHRRTAIAICAALPEPSLDVSDEWLLSISIMEAARRIGLEMNVGHSWRELAMLTNKILADQLRASEKGTGGAPTDE